MIAYVENSARPETWARDTGTIWQRCKTPGLTPGQFCDAATPGQMPGQFGSAIRWMQRHLSRHPSIF